MTVNTIKTGFNRLQIIIIFVEQTINTEITYEQLLIYKTEQILSRLPLLIIENVIIKYTCDVTNNCLIISFSIKQNHGKISVEEKSRKLKNRITFHIRYT